jgi:hypothetical protein
MYIQACTPFILRPDAFASCMRPQLPFGSAESNKDCARWWPAWSYALQVRGSCIFGGTLLLLSIASPSLFSSGAGWHRRLSIFVGDVVASDSDTWYTGTSVSKQCYPSLCREDEIGESFRKRGPFVSSFTRLCRFPGFYLLRFIISVSHVVLVRGSSHNM